jgi:hypothetical protein
MSDQTQFEGEMSTSKFQSRTIFGQPQTPSMVKFLISKGIVKDEKTAGHFLLGLTVFFFCLTIYIFIFYVFAPSPAPVPLSEETMRAIKGN